MVTGNSALPACMFLLTVHVLLLHDQSILMIVVIDCIDGSAESHRDLLRTAAQ